VISEFNFLKRGLLREIEPVISLQRGSVSTEAEIVSEDQRKGREADAEPEGAT